MKETRQNNIQRDRVKKQTIRINKEGKRRARNRDSRDTPPEERDPRTPKRVK